METKTIQSFEEEDSIFDTPQEDNEPLKASNSPRSGRPGQKNKSQPRNSLQARTLKGFLVKVVKNGFPPSEAKRYHFVSLEQLKIDCVSILNLTSHPAKIFSEEGQVITDASQISEQMLLYISTGAPFSSGLTPKSARRVSKRPASRTAASNADVSPDHEEKVQKHEDNDNQDTNQEGVSKEKEARRAQEIASYHRMLFLNPRTPAENMRDAAISVFAQLSPAQKAKMPNATALRASIVFSQQAQFVEMLVNEQICPSSRSKTLEDPLNLWCMDFLKGTATSDIHYIITGPRQSGKTSLLFILANQLLRKLQNSDEALSFLLFPLNFMKHTLELSNPLALARLIIRQTAISARFALPALLPYLEPLFAYFISLLTPGSEQPFPAPLRDTPLLDLGKNLTNTLKTDSEGKRNSEAIALALASFPRDFARAAGLSDAIYFLDHFEYASTAVYEIYPPNPKRTTPPSTLATLFSHVLADAGRFVVAPEEESALTHVFSGPEASQLDTAGLLHLKMSARLKVIAPRLDVTLGRCRGCPGYISRFLRLFEAAERANEGHRCPYAAVRSAVQQSRLRIIKKQLMPLLQFLAGAGDQEITPELLNDVESSDTVPIEIEGDLKQEEEEEEPENDEGDENNGNDNENDENNDDDNESNENHEDQLGQVREKAEEN